MAPSATVQATALAARPSDRAPRDPGRAARPLPRIVQRRRRARFSGSLCLARSPGRAIADLRRLRAISFRPALAVLFLRAVGPPSRALSRAPLPRRTRRAGFQRPTVWPPAPRTSRPPRSHRPQTADASPHIDVPLPRPIRRRRPCPSSTRRRVPTTARRLTTMNRPTFLIVRDLHPSLTCRRFPHPRPRVAAGTLADLWQRTKSKAPDTVRQSSISRGSATIRFAICCLAWSNCARVSFRTP